MAVDSFLISFNVNFSLFFLLVLFATINLSWMFVFVISIRSYLHTPSMSVKETYSTSYQIHHRLPFVSIIVPARNEQNNIKRCILSLLDQDYPSFEVIVVDDNSTDKTLRIVQDVNSEIKGLRVNSSLPIHRRLKIVTITEKPDKWTGKTWASEQGYLQSTGDIL